MVMQQNLDPWETAPPGAIQPRPRYSRPGKADAWLCLWASNLQILKSAVTDTIGGQLRCLGFSVQCDAWET